MTVNVENVEVQDVEDITTIEGAGPSDEGEATAGDAAGTPEAGLHTEIGEGVSGDVEDGQLDEAGDGHTETITTPEEELVETPGPVTDTYANDGMYVDCSNQTTTYWLETSEILVYPDGTVEFTEAKPVRTETSWPSTSEELVSRGCEIPAEVTTPVAVEEVTVAAPTTPVREVALADTGSDLSAPVILGAMLVSVVGAWLIANAIANKNGRKK